MAGQLCSPVQLPLSPDAASQALQHTLCDALSMDAPAAAFGVAEIVEEDMANAAREHATESGTSM